MSIYSFTLKSIDGKTTSLETFKGKTLLIVNVASKCGYTPQYTGLQELYEQFQNKGLVVLGIPCNQFGAQEPGTEEEIQQFCSLNYAVSFPMFAKIDVNGEKEHSLYTFLKAKDPDTASPTPIKWNFTKFLVDKTGRVVKRFLHSVEPKELRLAIEAIL